MESAVIRMECLKLARTVEAEPKRILLLADAFAKFIEFDELPLLPLLI